MGINYELKALRARYNIRQDILADLLNITVSTYNRKENGNSSFTVEEAQVIAQLFNTTMDRVFGK
ncbi:helix-turn-helix transcriptional regulator [Clostridium lundense]|uniref:helix-turn-helix transcriptional regulator n=1 Tax=Clostridium lundense TaxID=319475 RepID=UPI000480AF06|nr:helix-turn-helix transcriptional regulator [Clostridium lundense]